MRAERPAQASEEVKKADDLVRGPSGLLTTPSRSRLMRAVRTRDTKAEVLLRQEIWKRGYRFLKNVKGLPGRPDVLFRRAQVAVFVDGDFWHGRDWLVLRERITRNRDFWVAKIERTIERDRENRDALIDLGYRVVRVWERDVLRDPKTVADDVLRVVDSAFRTS